MAYKFLHASYLKNSSSKIFGLREKKRLVERL